MTKFNISRFGRTLAWSAQMTKKEALTQCASMVFAFTVPFIIHLLSSYKASEMTVANNLTTATQMNILIYLIFAMIGGCWLFNNMKTKEQRITFKMLPATDLEKFVVRALYATVVWWLMGFIAFCLADLFRMLISLIAGIDIVKSAIPDFLNMLFGGNDHNISILGETDMTYVLPLTFAANAWAFWVHSLYILGGALFRRRQFVLTTLAHCIIGLAFTPIIVDFVDSLDNETAEQMFCTVMWTAGSVFTLLFLLNWWLSYKIFRRMQVINNKWLNL